MKLALDTSAYVWLRKNEAQVVGLLQRASAVFISMVAIGELEAAFHGSSRAAENQALLDAFLAEPIVSTVEVTRAVARRFGRLHARLKRRGTPLPVSDLWIAACALEVDAPLVTFDRDFRHLEELSLRLLTPPTRR